MIRVAINGYGRIGRIAHRVILEHHSSELEVVAINAGSSTDLKGWMYLLKYDTSYGPLFNHQIESEESREGNEDYLGKFIIDNKDVFVYSQKDPSLLPWRDHDIDVVIECTGHFKKVEDLSKQIDAGAKAVVVSAPTKGEIPTYVMSVNHNLYSDAKIISNASCTTNCITPVAKIIDETLGVEKAMMTTVHAYTSDQRLQDGGHKDYRRARAAAENIIPTSTGATSAASEAYSPLKDKFGGLAIRVPVITGSLSDLTFLLKRDTNKEEINEILTNASKTPQYRGIVEVTNDPIVSSDIIGNSHSAIVDLSLTQVVGGNMAKVIAWYDNEYGYANRLVEEAIMICS